MLQRKVFKPTSSAQCVGLLAGTFRHSTSQRLRRTFHRETVKGGSSESLAILKKAAQQHRQSVASIHHEMELLRKQQMDNANKRTLLELHASCLDIFASIEKYERFGMEMQQATTKQGTISGHRLLPLLIGTKEAIGTRLSVHSKYILKLVSAPLAHVPIWDRIVEVPYFLFVLGQFGWNWLHMDAYIRKLQRVVPPNERK
jgi:hypothetical protein